MALDGGGPFDATNGIPVKAMTALRKFVINGRFLDPPISGVQRYAREIVAALDRHLAVDPRPDEQWCLATTGHEIDPPRLEHIPYLPLVSPFKGHAWDQISLLRASRDSALIGLAGSGPMLHRRQLVVIHDANVFRNPAFFSRPYGMWHRSIGRTLSRRATIATVSNFSRRELAAVLGIAPSAIPVFANGSDHMKRWPASSGAYDRLGLSGRPYFVLLGNLTPNKNVAVAIEAIQHVPSALLVLVGGVDYRVFGNDGPAVNGERVIFAGRLEDAEVSGLLQQAQALLFPSFYEGFGIPPVEAMVNRCPVIASDIPAVHEVCAEAALYFDPHDPSALRRAMIDVMDENKVASAARRNRGEERAARFSWHQSARVLLDHCRQSLAASLPRP